MSQPTFLTVEEVARYLRVTRQTVSRYISDKALNAIKINKSYRISSDDFESFLARNALAHEPQFALSKNSKNCTLEYPGKSNEDMILSQTGMGRMYCVEKNHPGTENKFIFGDNLYVLQELLKTYRGAIDLVYIDPPFGTGQEFNSIENENAYSDTLADSAFLEFLRKRLILLRELLSEKGSIYLHIDKKIGHYVKIIMDEIFGHNNFINDITRIKCNPKNFARNAYGNYSDMILFYARHRDKNIWNNITEPMSEAKRKELFPKKHPEYGYYTTNPIHAPGKTRDGDTGKEWQGLLPPKGRHWRYSRKVLTELDEKGLIEWSETGNPRKIVPASEHKGFKIQDVWEYKDKGLSYVDYPTQKNHEMLERIILNSSNEGSIVLDCFAGSGSTLKVADRLNRKWIGIDNSPHAFNGIRNRFKQENIKCNYIEFHSGL